MRITNNSQALQGVNAKSGVVYIKPGESKDVEFTEEGAKQAKRLKFLSLGAKAAKEGGSTSTFEAKHRGGGSYSIFDGDKEVIEKLSKEDADAFNAMSATDQAAFVDLHKPE